RPPADVAGRQLLRVRSDLRRHPAGLPRTAVRLVRSIGSIYAGPAAAGRARPNRSGAAVSVLSDDQHALSVQPDAAVSTGLVAGGDRPSVRSRAGASGLLRHP